MSQEIPQLCRIRQRIAMCAAGTLLFGGMVQGYGEDVGRKSGFPAPLTEDDFSALKNHSPFLRSMGSSDSMVLTGIARIGEDVFITVVDTRTSESSMVSQSTNQQGWQLVSFHGNEDDPESLSAKIQIASGEVISIRYEKFETRNRKRGLGTGSGTGTPKLKSSELREAKMAALNYKEGFSSDGYPKEPPSEIVRKLAKMTVQERESLNQQMIELRNKGLGMDARRRIYVDRVNRAIVGRR